MDTPPLPKEETLDALLKEAEKDVEHDETASTQADKVILQEIAAIEGSKATTELGIQRDLLLEETDLTRKIEAELWNGAHIACLPYFYETYTIQARVEPETLKKYNKATLTTCSRFNALGANGLAMVSPIVDFIRNYPSYTPADRKKLDDEVVKRVVNWLKVDIMPESRPRPILTQSLEKVMQDIAEAEQVFVRAQPEAVYMEEEAQMAAVKAIRNSMFLPGRVKISLLESLKNMAKDEIFDIGTFLLWEIRKSSHHHNLLLYTMLKIFQELIAP
ncbi:hypothetical protein HZC27_01680 [Candidatus Roizmanbacteria bacterium]|nr:hypothetical protein [Candidatus Roizmanbacteria bacterium]